jgi:hypothetical protein
MAGGGREKALVDVEPVIEAWHYMDDRDVPAGPVPREQLIDLFNRGKITPQTLVWNTSLPDWESLESVPGFLDRVTVSPRKPPGQLNLLALMSLIAAVVWLGGLGSAAAVVLGVLALLGGRRPGAASGRWMAITGVVLGGIGLVLTLILVPVLYFALREPAPLNSEQISSRYKEKVYILKLNDGSSGSGILLANNRTHGLIATNLHVVIHVVDPFLEKKPVLRPMAPENGVPKTATVVAKNPFQVAGKTARVAAIHRHNDLALVVIDMENVAPDAVPIIRKHRLRDGEPAVALGYPLGKPYNVSTGVISSTGGERGAVWTTCALSNGNSGGPLFLQRRGMLVGLNTFISTPEGAIAQNLNGAEPAEELVAPIQAGRTDKWIWAPDLKEIVIELVKQVPVRD